MPQPKFKQIAHAKAKWDLEVKAWRQQSVNLFKMEKQLKEQQQRVHNAYVTYKALVEKDKRYAS